MAGQGLAVGGGIPTELLARTWLSALLVLATAAPGLAGGIDVPAILWDEPFQIIRPTPDHTGLTTVPEALTRLDHHTENIALVAVVGPFHSGKSFLLNALLGNMRAFSVGPKTSPETMGVWLCRTRLRAADGSEVWLLDSEGFFGPGVPEDYDAKIFTVASLLGAHLMYNTVKVIDQQAVNLLEMLVRRAQLFRTRSAAEKEGLEIPEFLSSRSFPPLTWVVEDFVQKIPAKHREDGATGWLKTYLHDGGSASEGESDSILTQLYANVRAHTLFLPAKTKEQLQDLSRLQWSDLTQEFRDEVKLLKDEVLASLRARRVDVDGQAMTGRKLKNSLHFIVQALKRGMFPDLPSLWVSWASQVAEMSLNDADEWFASLMRTVDNGADPIPVGLFNNRIEDARKRASNFYHALLRDFEILPQDSKLSDRQNTHFHQALKLYHERVKRWSGEVVQDKARRFNESLRSYGLPMDPAELHRKGQKAGEVAVEQLKKDLSRFASPDKPVSLGKAATMPPFVEDPPSRLAAEIRELLLSQELENERGISLVFKAAVSAAEEAVEAELRSVGLSLCGRARVLAIREEIEAKCWRAFEGRLLQYKPWISSLKHFATHKAVVQIESLDRNWAKFVAGNEQRLTAHFREVQNRLAGMYAQEQTLLALPMDEGELEKKHLHAKQSVNGALQEQSRELQDTETFKQISQRLNQGIQKDYHNIRAKNVELWKAHSDEATRCAVEKNRLVRMSSRWYSTVWFMPWVHKATSRKNLFSCFSRTTVHTRSVMSESMKNQVFNSWYDKEMAHEANRVFTNMVTIIGGAVLLAIMLCYSGKS